MRPARDIPRLPWWAPNYLSPKLVAPRTSVWLDGGVERSPFLAELHRQFGVPRSVVVRLAEKADGGHVEKVERVVRGYDNEVYRVGLAAGLAVYVRIRRYGEGQLDQEVWAMAQARDAGLPVPEVLAMDAASELTGGHPVMVVAAAAGRPLEQVLARASPADRQRVLIRLGSTLAQLHSVPAPGVWRPDSFGQWPDPDRLRQGFIAERRGEVELLLTAGLTPAEVDRASALLDLSPDPPGTGFVLCHGDVSPEHVFIDAALRVSGLIDWGEWHGGSPIGELALIASTFGWDDLEPVLQGYGHSPSGDISRGQIATTAVGQLTGHIAHHISLNDPEGASQNVAALRRALRILG